ncbi:MAG: GGDEF domain-containing protein [Desulfobacterales bacterium]|jgi:diguanylate cyclase (GGDEF)-like protein/PAS domain S-box-containing protein
MNRAEGFHPSLLDQLYDGVYFVDRNRRVTYWNRGAERLTGYAPEEVVGQRDAESLLMHLDEDGNDMCREDCPLSATLQDGQVREAEAFLQHKHGHRLPVTVRVAPILSEAGAVTGAVEIFRDNSGKIDLADRLARLEKQALLDALTGIGNRRYLERHLEARAEELRRYGVPFGVLFIDIDRFRQVNETHGYPMGDRVLHMVAQTIAANLRPFDEAGRWEGEQFVVVVANVDDHALSIVAERIRMLVAASSIKGVRGPLRVTISIGAALAGAEEGPDSVIERAEQLMQQSKIAGRNQVSLVY